MVSWGAAHPLVAFGDEPPRHRLRRVVLAHDGRRGASFPRLRAAKSFAEGERGARGEAARGCAAASDRGARGGGVTATHGEDDAKDRLHLLRGGEAAPTRATPAPLARAAAVSLGRAPVTLGKVPVILEKAAALRRAAAFPRPKPAPLGRAAAFPSGNAAPLGRAAAFSSGNAAPLGRAAAFSRVTAPFPREKRRCPREGSRFSESHSAFARRNAAALGRAAGFAPGIVASSNVTASVREEEGEVRAGGATSPLDIGALRETPACPDRRKVTVATVSEPVRDLRGAPSVGGDEPALGEGKDEPPRSSPDTSVTAPLEPVTKPVNRQRGSSNPQPHRQRPASESLDRETRPAEITVRDRRPRTVTYPTRTRARRTASTRFFTSMGLARKSSKPARRHLSRSPGIALAVSATMGRRDRQRHGADSANGLVTIDLRHHDVHEHRVDVRPPLQELEPFAGVAGRQCLGALAFEEGRNREQVARIVVDDEDLAFPQWLRRAARVFRFGGLRLGGFEGQRGCARGDSVVADGLTCFAEARSHRCRPPTRRRRCSPKEH